MAQRNRESSSGCFLCCRMWLENHTNEIKKSGLLKVTSSQFLSLLTLAFPYWLLVVIMTFSPLPLSLSHTHTYKMKTLTGTHQPHTHANKFTQSSSQWWGISFAGGARQRRRSRESRRVGECRILLLPLGGSGAYVFKHCVQNVCFLCVCAQLLEPNVPTRTQGWDLHGANLGLHHEVTLN